MAVPPALPRALAQFLTRREAREVIVGDLDEEFHALIAAGVPASVARRRYWRQAIASLFSLGRRPAAPNYAIDREAAPPGLLATGRFLLQDIRHGLRLVARAPAFAAAAILTLAVGLGANAAIFTVAWHAMLKPLPYPNADRLVTVWELVVRTDARNTVMPSNFRDWEREAASFQSIAAFSSFRGTLDLTGGGEPEQWRVRHVTPRYFEVFGMPALVGRPLGPGDADRLTVVLSDGVWRRRFAADRAIVGREIQLSDRAALVVGVMPGRFEEEAGRVDAWAAFDLPPQTPANRLGAHYLGVVARLKPGVRVEHADAELRAIAARAAELYPRENGGLLATVASIERDRGATIRLGLTLLVLSAAAVLIIACANLASLQMSRSAARLRELSIRASLGASRRRLVAQLLTESLVLAAVGAVLGTLLGGWLLKGFATFAPAAVRPAAAAGPDAVVLMFTAGLAILSGLVFATWPAWQVTRRASAWLGRRHDTGDRRARTIRTALVTLQVAFAVVLLISAATLTRSLRVMLAVDPGFRSEGVLTFDLSLARVSFDVFPKYRQFLDRVIAEVRAAPGITAACAINEVPFETQGGMTYVPEGQDRPVHAAPRNVTATCFDLLSIPLVRGRGFSDREPARVAIVSESFAAAAWPGADALGKRVHVGVKEGPLLEVVGVVGDTRQRSLVERPRPVLYETAVAGSAFPPGRILARTRVAPESLFPGVRAAVRRIDGNQPVAQLRTLEAIRSGTVAGSRFDLSLVSTFSLMAMILAVVGIYGLLAHTVAQRSGEIGVRLALGATPQSVVRLVMGAAAWSIGAGALLGLGGALAASRLLRQMVFGVSPTEPALYAGALFTLVALGLLAAWIPARRAARIDPVQTLNQR